MMTDHIGCSMRTTAFSGIRKGGVTDANYYGGTYKLYRGEKAMDFIEKKLSSYGVTKAQLMEVINRSDEYKVEDFICIYTKNTTFMLDGKEQISKPNMIPYMGFF